MPVTNYPNGLSSFGIPVLPGLDITPAGAQAFFVCNRSGANGSDGNRGTDPLQPLATVDAAIGLCQSGRGDVIFVMEGHAETVTATSIALDVAGVKVIGLGQGASRPTFSFSVAGSTVTVSAAGCRWSNMHHIAVPTSVTTAFTIGAAKSFLLDSNTFIDTDATHGFLAIVTTGATDNAHDWLTVRNNHVIGLLATDGPVVSILAATVGLVIADNVKDSLATADAGHLLTMSSKACTGTRIVRNVLTLNALSSQSTGTLLTGSSTACSGIVGGNWVYQIDTSTGLLATAGTKMGFIENYMSGAADKSGSIFPAVDDPA